MLIITLELLKMDDTNPTRSKLRPHLFVTFCLEEVEKPREVVLLIYSFLLYRSSWSDIEFNGSYDTKIET